jgi:hypothetical protein
LNTTKNYPIIKYGKSTKYDSVFRLFTNNDITKDGSHVPVVSLHELNAFDSLSSNTNNISIFITFILNDIETNIICELNKVGSLTVYCEFKSPVDITHINVSLTTYINPIIKKINNFFNKESNFSINIFENINDINIDILDIKYLIQVNSTKKYNMKKISTCAIQMFNIINETKNSLDMRFKRISNYDKQISQKLYVLNKIKLKYSSEDIILSLLKQFPELTEKDAIIILNDITQNINNDIQDNEKASIVKINQGFDTNITLNDITNNLTIIISKINNINYLETIPIYLDTLIRIIEPQTNVYIKQELNNICKQTTIEPHINVIQKAVNDITYTSLRDDNVNKINNIIGIINTDNKINNNLNILDIDSDDDESDSDDENEIYGGNLLQNDKNNDDVITNDTINNEQILTENELDGVAIKDLNFKTKMQKLEPKLFISQKKGNYKSYSKICSASARRQPIILTDSELENITSSDPTILNETNGDVLKYKTPTGDNYNYICPRFWCLKTQKPISGADVKAGKCGGIIPKDALIIPKGKYVYEFFNENVHGTRDNYIQQYPGFLDKKQHSDGLCIPCCFGNFNSVLQTKRRNECNSSKKEYNKNVKIKESDDPKESKKTKKKYDIINPRQYIINSEKFPTPIGRWSNIPISIQKLFHSSSIVKYDQGLYNNTNFKENIPYLVRHGIEFSENQSFIGCFADIIYYLKKNIDLNLYKIPTIKKFKRQIIDSILSIDIFLTLQNGNLVNKFSPSIDELNKIDIDVIDYIKNEKQIRSDMKKSNYPIPQSKYSIINNINIDDVNQYNYLKQLILSYNNFKLFLEDDDVLIDHTYLWDLFASPNKLLFPRGINIIIFEYTNNDITNNVDYICPLNGFSNYNYNPRQDSVFLLKQGNLYEPIYLYTDNGGYNVYIDKTFNEVNKFLPQIIKDILQYIIKPISVQNICTNKNKSNEIIGYEPIDVSIIRTKIKLKYEIKKQIINYDSKVIGLLIFKKDDKNINGFIPCKPSFIDNGIPFSFMTDDDIWNNYENTKLFLDTLTLEYKGKLKCSPHIKVVDDNVVVGFLTQTNQFVQISPPILLVNTNDSIKVLSNENYVVNNEQTELSQQLYPTLKHIDSEIMLSNTNDDDRINYINNIKHETLLYNIFRNIIRLFINDYNNISFKDELETILLIKSTTSLEYNNKLKNIIGILKHINNGRIIFNVNYDTNLLHTIDNDNGIDLSQNDYSNICDMLNNNNCVIKLPKHNLVTNKLNEKNYYIKLADDFLRNKRISLLLLNSNIYISFTQINFIINDNEFILLKSLIDDYYKKPLKKLNNKHIKNITNYDLQYSNNNNNINYNITYCNIPIPEKINSIYWSKFFIKNTNEYIYSNNNVYCTYSPIIELYQNKYNKNITIKQIQHDLYNEYIKYTHKYYDKIIHIIGEEGNSYIIKKLVQHNIEFNTLFYLNNYKLTTFDMWVLFNKYKIPNIILSNKSLLETLFNKKYFKSYGNADDKFSFIFVVNKSPLYRLVTHDNTDNTNTNNINKNNYYFGLDYILNEKGFEKLNNVIHEDNTIEHFLEAYDINMKLRHINK